jgi:beta-galactosidase
LFETEVRKIKKLKEVGFNAIRTSHNPPSKVLIEVCDRLGMYVLDEAFDAWNMGKRSGDYSQYFDADWEKDLTSFVTRDRNSPAVIMWSTGNEIPERGGLSDGYKVASKLAAKVKSLDPSRPVCNAVCSMWSGLDDELASSQNHQQNASARGESLLWENVTLPFTNGLDIVGYNYLEGLYEKDHELFPDRVILGSENFPKEIGFRWPFIEEHPYVIGDFTWTAWDYIGEAGIGKAVYVDENDPKAPKNPWEVMPYTSSPYPWRCANDADFDITGRLLPQGQYRSIAWHSDKTYVYSKHPDTFGKKEICSMWGFPYVDKNWNYKGYEGKDIEIVVFSSADEVEVLVNGKSIGVKRTDLNDRFPNCAVFETVYEEGVVEAISYKLGAEAVSGSCNNDNNDSDINTDKNTDKDVARVVISRDTLETTKVPAAIRLVPEKTSLKADGHDVSYIGIEIVDEDGAVVPDAEVSITASISGKAKLSGLGTGNPKTEENYTDNITTTYKGMAMAVLRSGYEKGEATLTIESQDFLKKEIKITLE